jgi:hypothetical protein
MNVLFNFAVGNGGAFLGFALTETTLSRALQTLAPAGAKWLMTINLVTVGLLTGKSVTIVPADAPAAKGVPSYVVAAEMGRETRPPGYEREKRARGTGNWRSFCRERRLVRNVTAVGELATTDF